LHFLEVSPSSGRGFRLVSARGSLFRLQLDPPAPRSAFEDMAVVEEAVEHGGDSALSPSSFPESSTEQLEVSSVLARS